MSPKFLKKSQFQPRLVSPETFKIARTPLTKMCPNLKPVKFILFSKSGVYESPKQERPLQKKRKRSPDDHEHECEDTKAERLGEEDIEPLIRRTRSENPDLYAPLLAPTHSRRPKVYPSLTPWLDDWNISSFNDLYPNGGFKWDSSDVPDFDLGEPLDEINFWETSWIASNEEKKRCRYEREKKRKKQLRFGGLKAAARRRAFRNRVGVTMKREHGKFVKLESD